MQGRINGKSNWVWSRDPAVDGYGSEEEKQAAIAETNDKQADIKELKRTNGRQPVVWHFVGLNDEGYTDFTRAAQPEAVRILARGIASAVMQRATYIERREAFRRGVVGVENAAGRDKHPLKLEFAKDSSGNYLTAETMKEIHDLFGPKLIGEVGQAVIEASEVDPL